MFAECTAIQFHHKLPSSGSRILAMLPLAVVSGSSFVSRPCRPECYLQSEAKIEPDLRLMSHICIYIQYICDWPCDSVEPRFNKVPRDWGNLFVKSRVRYIEHLHLTPLFAIHLSSHADIYWLRRGTLYLTLNTVILAGWRKLFFKYRWLRYVGVH